MSYKIQLLWLHHKFLITKIPWLALNLHNTNTQQVLPQRLLYVVGKYNDL